MSVWAIFRVKDEADIIEQTVGHMLTQVDHVLVADNGSVDGTREILERLDVELIDDTEIGYYQSRIATEMADYARRKGARWVISADADEVWLTTGQIRKLLDSLDEHVYCVEASLFDHVATAQDDLGADPVARMGWRRTQPAPLRKVAVRAIEGMVIHQGNHSASFPGVDYPAAVTGQLEVRHFAIRTPEQMIRKARVGGAAYRATDLPEDIGAHWRQWDQLSDDALREVFSTYYWSADPESDPKLIFDPAWTPYSADS